LEGQKPTPIIQLDKILLASPNVIQIDSRFENGKITANYVEGTSYPALHTLKLTSGYADRNALDFLKRATPNLKNLEIDIVEDQPKKQTQPATYDLDLTGFYLNTLQIEYHIAPPSRTKNEVFLEIRTPTKVKKYTYWGIHNYTYRNCYPVEGREDEIPNNLDKVILHIEDINTLKLGEYTKIVI
jgi:hypothetical protein